MRAHRFDVNSNRNGYASTPSAATADASGDLVVCPTPTTPAVASTFDTGDRIANSGYAYDAFGRTIRLPLASGQVERVSYHANDLVATQTLYANAADADANNGTGQNPVDKSDYTLDLTGQRIGTRTVQEADADTGATTTRMRTLRYSGSGDSAEWTDEGDGSVTRIALAPTGDLASLAVFDRASSDNSNDELTWELSDIHGDVAASLPANTMDVIQLDRPDEFGLASGAIEGSNQYGWLGAEQRSADTPGHLTIMGVRLYNPSSGRFLSGDPVYGGNANAYSYPADPVNAYDLDGRMCYAGSICNAGGPTGATVIVGGVVIAVAGVLTHSVAMRAQRAGISRWLIVNAVHGVTWASIKIGILFAKASKKSGKEKASDVPSYAKGARWDEGRESLEEAVKRVMGNRYNPKSREYSQIKKYLSTNRRR